MSIKKISYLYISLTVILWGSTAAIAKILLRTLDNLQILLYMSLVTVYPMWVMPILQVQDCYPIKIIIIKPVFSAVILSALIAVQQAQILPERTRQGELPGAHTEE